jgi:hypothetical protein
MYRSTLPILLLFLQNIEVVKPNPERFSKKERFYKLFVELILSYENRKNLFFLFPGGDSIR